MHEEEKDMSMIDKVRAEMVAAMKNKEKDRKDALSMLLSALKNKAIDKRADSDGRGRIRSSEKGDEADSGDA